MFYTKLFLVVGVSVVLFVTCEPPYFPIEISRCIASNVVSTAVFVTCVFASMMAFLALDKRPLTPPFALFFVGLTMVGLLSDTTHWLGHMVGVALVMIAIYAQLSPNIPWVFVVAVLIYVLRLLIKAVAIVFLERPVIDLRQLPLYLLEMKQLAFRLMFTGRADHPLTVTAFAWGGGFLQWIVFALLAWCLK